MNIVFAGGGSGGHIYPAIALADELKRHNHISFVGTSDGLESTIVPKSGYHLEMIYATPFSLSMRCFWQNIKGVFQSRKLLKRLQPEIVFATGGYVCVPIVLAAKLFFFDIRVILLEQNAQASRANRALKIFADNIWHNAPVRASILRVKYIPKKEARLRLGLDPDKKTLLAMGGSQGAQSISNAVMGCAKHLPNWQILLIAGTNPPKSPSPNLSIVAYLHDMADAYAAADLVVSRAGASTLAELQEVGIPTILIPYPYAGKHQEANARRFILHNPASMLYDNKLTSQSLIDAVMQLIEKEDL